MGLRTIVFGLLVLLPVTMSMDEDEVDGGTYKSKITADGVTCKFAEYKHSDGKGPRGLHLYSCKNKNGNMKVYCIYYGGNPHNCADYKPNQQNSIKNYYTTLAKIAMNNGHPCGPEKIIENICDKEYSCVEGSCKKNLSFDYFQDEL